MKKVKWGVIGTASIAEGCTLPGIVDAENAELIAIAGRSKEKTDSFAEKFRSKKAYYNYDDVLNDPEIEAVYIPLPNDMHYEWVMKAIHAGKHVLCEKPIAPNAEQAKELFDEADKCGVVLMEAFAYLHSPIVHALKNEIDNGAVGKVNYIDTSFFTSMWKPDNIRLSKEKYGGCTYDLGCYLTSFALWMLGEEPETVKAVAEFSDKGVDLHTVMSMKWASGARASMSCGMVLEEDPFQRVDRMFINGSKGYIETGARFNQFGDITYRVVTADGIREEKVNVPQNYMLEVEQLSRCITDGEKPLVSHEFTIKNLNLLGRVLSEIDY